MSDLISRARLFSMAAHRGQARKYTSGPYFEHPERVAAEAALYGLSHIAIAAAYLHDVVEDCGVKLHEIEKQFGPGVKDMVDLLSDMQDPEKDGNRSTRKKQYRERLKEAVSSENQRRWMFLYALDVREVITLKMLDILDNARSIAGEAPKFWGTVREEMRLFFEDLGHYGHPKAQKLFKRHLDY